VVVDPRPWAVGSLRDTYRAFPSLGPVLPALGYGAAMIGELEQTLNAADAEVVLVGTPIDLGRFLHLNKPVQRARYELQEIGRPTLQDVLEERFGQ
jgi:predicted GTPase